MQKLKLSILAFVLLVCQLSFAQSSAIVRQYIERFKDAAIAEMQRTGVPAAITLAQGIHESSAGQSDLVVASNNHFGIKCKSGWTGETVFHDDDAKGECFRKYNDPIESYKDHSDFLKNRPNYTALFKLDPTDYEGWAYGLKKAGYATNPKYPQILIKIIKDYNLQEYSLIALGKKNKGDDNIVLASNTSNNDLKTVTQNTYPNGVFKINETNVVFVSKGTSFLAIAQKYDVSLPLLFEYNEMTPQDIATTDRLMFLQRKRRIGAKATHMVVAGETLKDIAQTEGIRLENLLAFNFLREDMQPESGQIVYLQKQAPAAPKLINTAQAEAYTNTKQSIAQNTASFYTVHVVRVKETAYSIARKYEVSVDDLLRWNNLATADLTVGQELHINKKAANAIN